MGWLQTCRGDPVLRTLEDAFGCTPLRVPEQRVVPLSAVSTTGDRTHFLGPLTELLAATSALELKLETSRVAPLAEQRTRRVDRRLGVQLLGGLMEGFGLPAARVERALGRGISVAFAFPDARRRFVALARLGRTLVGQRLDPDNHMTKQLTKGRSSLHVIDSTMVSRSFRVHMHAQQDRAAGVDAQAVADLVGANASVSTVTSHDWAIDFTSLHDLCFAFSSVRVLVSDSGGLTDFDLAANGPSFGFDADDEADLISRERLGPRHDPSPMGLGVTGTQSPAFRELQRKQAAIYAKVGRPAITDSVTEEAERADLLARYSGHAAQLAETADELAALEREIIADLDEAAWSRPTAYESLLDALIIRALVDELSRAEETRRMRPPVIGTLPLGRVGGHVWPGPDGVPVIAINDGTVTFARMVGNAVAELFPTRKIAGGISIPYDQVRAEQQLRVDGSPLAHFGELLRTYLITGIMRPTRPLLAVDEQASKLAWGLGHAGVLFVLAHEYAHVLEGHLAEPRDAPSRSMLANGYEIVPRAVEREHEADRLGAAIVIGALEAEDELPAPIAYAGVELLISAMDVVERGLATLRTGDPALRQTNADRPPTYRRRAALREWLRLTKPGIAGVARAYAQSVESVLDAFWTRLEPTYRAWHRQGVRPAAIWSPPRDTDTS